MSKYPTEWQRKTLWSAVSALSIVTIGAIGVGFVALINFVFGYLQPILIPFAVAGVMAYLLDPVVARISSWGTSRRTAVWAVFAITSLTLAGIVLWIVPALSEQTVNLAKKVPPYTVAARKLVLDFVEDVRINYGIRLLPTSETPHDPAPTPAAAPASPANSWEISADPSAIPNDPRYELEQFLSGDWVKTTLPTVLRNAWKVTRSSVGGFLGAFGFLLSMIIVPVYLYYFLVESSKISRSWGEYLPLRASRLKDEVVNVVDEVNGYLIAFFRGQLVVSIINGVATGTLLIIVGLDFGLLIGLMLCILGFIPYLGIAICWIPAVVIAAVQGGSWLVPGTPWWIFPLVVTGIFTIVQQIDGLFITPKIVGESVGLHPMTVIVSVFVWVLLLGGLLGAILAVPLTATIKVLLRRYIWQRKLRADAAFIPPSPPTDSPPPAADLPAASLSE